LTLEDGFQIYFTAQSKDNTVIEIMGPDSVCIDLDPVHQWVVSNSKNSLKISNAEEIMMIYAAECAQRWEIH
jgi:hypothetical protein